MCELLYSTIQKLKLNIFLAWKKSIMLTKPAVNIIKI